MISQTPPTYLLTGVYCLTRTPDACVPSNHPVGYYSRRRLRSNYQSILRHAPGEALLWIPRLLWFCWWLLGPILILRILEGPDLPESSACSRVDTIARYPRGPQKVDRGSNSALKEGSSNHQHAYCESSNRCRLPHVHRRSTTESSVPLLGFCLAPIPFCQPPSSAGYPSWEIWTSLECGQ